MRVVSLKAHVTLQFVSLENQPVQNSWERRDQIGDSCNETAHIEAVLESSGSEYSPVADSRNEFSTFIKDGDIFLP
jgi:hypothetical protein